jgi:hypothetical protein
MLVELNRSQIITLLTSIYPPYEWINELEHRKMGRYVGGMNDHWEWDRRAIYESKLFDEDLYELYQELLRNEE